MRPRTRSLLSGLAGAVIAAAAFSAIILSGNLPYGSTTTTISKTSVITSSTLALTTSVTWVTSTTTVASQGPSSSTRALPVGSGPVAAAYDPLSSVFYVVNQPSNQVTLTNSSGAALARVTVGQKPSGIAFISSDGLVAVSNFGDNSITLINASNVLGTVPLKGAGPTAMAFDPKNGDLYVLDSTSGMVEVIVSFLSGSPSGPLLIGSLTTTTVEVPPGPQGIAYNSEDTDIYVTSSGVVGAGPMGVVSVISSSSNTVVRSFPVGNEPRGIAYDPRNNMTYVADFLDNNLSIISSAGVSTMRVGLRPSSVTVNPSDGTVFVSNLGNNSIVLVSPNNKIRATLTGVGQVVGSGAIDPVLHSAFFPVFDRGVALLVNLQSFSAFDQVGAGDTEGAYNSYNHQMYITDQIFGIVWAYQAFTHKYTRINIGSGIEGSGYTPRGIAYNPVNHEIYVAVSTTGGHDTGYVYVIDSSNNIADQINLGDFVFPSGVTYNSDDQNVYVSAVTGGTSTKNPGLVFIIDSSDNVLTQIPVGRNAGAIAFNGANNLVYVANGGDGTVSEISDGCQCVILNITVSKSPSGIGIDPGANLIFVGDYNSGVVTVIFGAFPIQTLNFGYGVNDAAYDPSDGYVWVASANSVQVINPSTLQAVVTINNQDTINPSATCFAYSAAYNPAEQSMWVINQRAGSCDGPIVYNS